MWSLLGGDGMLADPSPYLASKPPILSLCPANAAETERSQFLAGQLFVNGGSEISRGNPHEIRAITEFLRVRLWLVTEPFHPIGIVRLAD